MEGNFIGTDANGANLGNPTGIVVDSGGNTIGGTTTGAANIIGFNSTAGVSMQSGPSVVAGNFIGTNAGGANLGNGVGLLVVSASNTIGGTIIAAANVIGFNTSAGVSISGQTATSNVMEGNFIGTNASGANLGSPIGILVESRGNTIGGTTTGAANIIGFNGAAGVSMSSTSNVVAGNLIGTDANGAKLGNAVGLLDSSGGNTVGGTTSARSKRDRLQQRRPVCRSPARRPRATS